MTDAALMDLLGTSMLTFSGLISLVGIIVIIAKGDQP